MMSDTFLDRMSFIEGADVILQGYRPGVYERRGFGMDYALEVAARRGKGICYLVSL